MNEEDLDIVRAERDADPDRFRNYFREPVNEEAESVRSSGSSSTHDALPSIRHTASAASRTFTRTSTQIEDHFMHYLDRHPTAIRRMQDHRLQHSQTVGSSRRGPVDTSQLPSFGGKKPYPPPLPPSEDYVVEFDDYQDPRHAMNWPTNKKLYISAILIFDSLAATFASSVFSPASTFVEEEFGKGHEVVVLCTSLFVLGYAIGPSIFAPMSELYGRKPPIVIAAFAFGIFNIGVAVAKDYQTLVLCRFFAGLFGSCPLAVVAAVFSDMFSNQYRGVAVTVFSGSVFNGPFMAPFIGGFIAKSYLGWRWCAYIPAFMGFAAGTLALLFLEESYGPVILVSKASELRRLTRNWGIHAKQEEVEVDLQELAVKNIARPLRILFTEPIVLLVTIYMSFLYGLLYLSLTAYGIVFGQIYGFSLGVSGLPYFGLIVGVGIGIVLSFIDVPRYIKKLDANDNIPVPEWRLPIAMVGGIAFTIGLFWFGWTAKASIPWIVPTLAGIFIGFGLFAVFLGCLNYIIDAYLMLAASAIAANTIMRSLAGAIFPLFATYMFDGIGIDWGMTLLGCFSALFIPMPFIFYFFGKRIRARSKFAPASDIEKDKEKHRDEEENEGGGGSS